VSYFNHGRWLQIKADLALQPLPVHAPDVVRRLLAGEEFAFPSELSYEQAVLDRLDELGLIESGPCEDWEDESYTRVASLELVEIETRGLLDELFTAAKAA